MGFLQKNVEAIRTAEFALAAAFGLAALAFGGDMALLIVITSVGCLLASTGVLATTISPKWKAFACVFIASFFAAEGALLRWHYIDGEPDIVLRFVNPSHPFLEVVNVSGADAQNIKYCVVVWNLDGPPHVQPIPIPWASYEFMLAHESSSPIDVFGTARTGPIENNTRLFGSACVKCPGCRHKRTYWLYIVWGQGGWYSEIPNSDGGAAFPNGMTNFSAKAFADRVLPTIQQKKQI